MYVAQEEPQTTNPKPQTVLCRNARQRTMSSTASNYYSYTRYDTLGRITEVGQIKDTSGATPITDSFTRNQAVLENWFFKNNKYRAQITRTVYDIAFFTDPYIPQWVAQKNLRNRVSYVSYSDTVYVAAEAYNNASFYSYDIHGNVDTLVQDYGFGGCCNTALWNVMNRNGNRWKKLIYQYDLISGKVNQVMYQKGWADQWFHRYSYDAENRLVLAETSLDSMVWERDARYEYYLHGPLARTTLGDQQVQGMDYAYTLQGWLKGINSTGGTIDHDIGGDGKASHVHQYTARDAIGLTLNYFEGEYKPINTGVNPFPNYKDSLVLHNTYRPLYNGNISSMSTYLRGMTGSTPDEPLLFNNYRYDQLNRLTGQTVFKNDSSSNKWALHKLKDSMYAETIRYDGNGNIQKYLRYGNKTDGSQLMDHLTYTYYNGTNQLRRVRDSVDAPRYGSGSLDMDIDDQSATDNYVYDSIGNMISDAGEGITNIRWNVYGKITEIIRVSNGFVPLDTIRYSYDAMGNRIGKAKRLFGKWNYTWYVRDAQGNVIATYDDENNHSGGYVPDPAAINLSLSERYMYGSSRLGVTTESNGVDNGNNGPGSMQFYSGSQFYRGKKRYELTNHLGNVLTVISDKKLGISSGGSLIDYYNPEIKSAQDYYPFGMTMPGRFPLGGAPYYKYTFNGKENDWEAKGWQNQQDYGMRVYDGRLGRFLSTDPITAQYPELTPYQFASNRPVQGVDLDGLEFSLGGFNFDPNTNVYARDDFSNAEKKLYGKQSAINGGVALAIVTDIFVTKGWLTRTILLSQAAGLVEHNRAKTEDGRKQQDKRFKENAADFAVNLGGAEVIGKVFKGIGIAFSKAKTLFTSSYSYGEATISVKVGNEVKEVGSGGIGHGGYLELNINVKQGVDGAKVARGEDVFDALYQSLKANAAVPINGIRGHWYSGEMGDNLATFNKLILEKVNKGKMTLQQAALETFTGKMAQKQGFTTVKSISGETNADGTYKFVNSVIFGK